MPVTLDKGRLLKSLQAQRVLFEVTLEQLTAGQMLLPGVQGVWTVKDIVAHVTAWDVLGTRWIIDAGRGELPAMPQPGRTWADLDAINAEIYAENRERPLAEVLTRFEAAWLPLLDAVYELPETEIMRMLTFHNGHEMQTMPVGGLVRWRYRHYRDHAEQIRVWAAAHLAR